MSDAGNSPGARSRSASPGARSPRDRSPPPRRDSRSRSRSPADGKEAAPRDSSGSGGGGGGGGGGGDTDNPGNNVYVANLAMRVTEDDLNDLFAKFGRVDKCEVILDPVSRTSRGFGFVTFEDIRDAEDAVKEMNGKEIQGRRIRVEHAKRKRGHEKTPGRYLGPRQASAKYGRDSREGDRGRDRSRDRDRRRSRSRSRDRGGHSRRSDDYDRDRYERSRYDDRGDRGRDRYDDSRRTRR